MDTTPIYQIHYPTATDLVSGAPDQLRQLATDVETACKTIDDRSTPEGATPVVRATRDLLDSASGTIGQTGYVTDGELTFVRSASGSWRSLISVSGIQAATVKVTIKAGESSAAIKFTNSYASAPTVFNATIIYNEVLDFTGSFSKVGGSGFIFTPLISSFTDRKMTIDWTYTISYIALWF